MCCIATCTCIIRPVLFGKLHVFLPSALNKGVHFMFVLFVLNRIMNVINPMDIQTQI